MSFSILQLVSANDGSRSEVVKADLKKFAQTLKTHSEENKEILKDHILILLADVENDNLEWSRAPLINVEHFISLYDNTILGE